MEALSNAGEQGIAALKTIFSSAVIPTPAPGMKTLARSQKRASKLTVTTTLSSIFTRARAEAGT